MAWSIDVGRQVRAEFRSAQRLARQVFDRASDEDEVVPIGPRPVVVVRANRRIVTGRESVAR